MNNTQYKQEVKMGIYIIIGVAIAAIGLVIWWGLRK